MKGTVVKVTTLDLRHDQEALDGSLLKEKTNYGIWKFDDFLPYFLFSFLGLKMREDKIIKDEVIKMTLFCVLK